MNLLKKDYFIRSSSLREIIMIIHNKIRGENLLLNDQHLLILFTLRNVSMVGIYLAVLLLFLFENSKIWTISNLFTISFFIILVVITNNAISNKTLNQRNKKLWLIGSICLIVLNKIEAFFSIMGNNDISFTLRNMNRMKYSIFFVSLYLFKLAVLCYLVYMFQKIDEGNGEE
jgi:hypothetical protein